MFFGRCRRWIRSLRVRSVRRLHRCRRRGKDSQTETFVAMRLEIDNWRWPGVPIFLRAGKALTERSPRCGCYPPRAVAEFPAGPQAGRTQPDRPADRPRSRTAPAADRAGRRLAGATCTWIRRSCRPGRAAAALRAAAARRADRRPPAVRPRGRHRRDVADRAAPAGQPRRGPRLRTRLVGAGRRAVCCADTAAGNSRGCRPTTTKENGDTCS